MRSPKSRILQLKQEIAELDQKLVSSCATKQEIHFPPQLSSNKKDQEREEIIQKLKSLRISTSGKSETLQSQLLDNQSKLKLLSLKKQSEINANRCTRERMTQKISSKNHSLQTYYEELQSLSSLISKKQKQKEDSSLAKAKAYEESLLPLEKEAEKLSKERERLVQEQIRLQEDLRASENIYWLCKEDILSRYAQRTDYIGQREEIEVHLESLELDNPDLLEYVTEEDNNSTKTSNKLLSLKEKHKDELFGIENSIENNNMLIETLERKHSKILNEIEDLLSNGSDHRVNSDINKIERYISEKSADFDIDSLENVILDLNALERFDIDEEILRLQLEEVNKQELKLQMDFDYEEKELLERINSGEVLGESVQLAENELMFKVNRYRNRLAAISQWKEEVEAVICRTVSNVQVLIQDRTIIEEYCASFGRISSNLSRQQLASLIDNYYAKVTSRDKLIQSSINAIKKKYTEKSQLLNMLSQAQQEKIKLQSEKFRILQVHLEDLHDSSNKSQDNYSNSIIEQVFSLKRTYADLTRLISSEAKLHEKSSQTLKEILATLESLKKSLSSIRYSINKLAGEEHTLHFQIEKTLENQRKDMISSLQELSGPSNESEEYRIKELRQIIEESTSQVESLSKDLNKFDADSLAGLAVLEQEESILRTQQQVLESAMRSIEIDNKRIKEMEQQLAKLEESDAAPTPECLQDQSRSKSVPKIDSSSSEKFSASSRPNQIMYTNESEESTVLSSTKPYIDYLEKPVGRHISLSTDRNLLIMQRPQAKKPYKFNQEDSSQIEKFLFEKIIPLFEGAELYKKFSQRSTLKQQSFDPLDVARTPPEVCGYGLRHFKLSRSITSIDVKQPLKPGFDSNILVEHLLAPIIPQITMAILKVQKHLGHEDLDFDRVPEKSYEKMKEIGVIDTTSQAFRDRCKTCVWYPFSLALMQGGRIELIAKGYHSFKTWVNGVNAIVKYKKLIPRLRQSIESHT